jgi:hypothetical protein
MFKKIFLLFFISFIMSSVYGQNDLKVWSTTYVPYVASSSYKL